jgi:hypothetical protein
MIWFLNWFQMKKIFFIDHNGKEFRFPIEFDIFQKQFFDSNRTELIDLLGFSQWSMEKWTSNSVQFWSFDNLSLFFQEISSNIFHQNWILSFNQRCFFRLYTSLHSMSLLCQPICVYGVCVFWRRTFILTYFFLISVRIFDLIQTHLCTLEENHSFEFSFFTKLRSLWENRREL